MIVVNSVSQENERARLMIPQHVSMAKHMNSIKMGRILK